MRAITVLAALAAVFGAILIAGAAAAKGGPFRAEISGGGLASPITIEGPLSGETVFLNDEFEAAPPKTLEPAYTVKLMPEQPDGKTGEYPVLTLTYFPGDGDGPALLRGEWGSGDRYFEASAAFRAALDGAIGAASVDESDGVGVVWYIAPGLASVGLLLIGGLAGRRLLFRG